MKTQSTYPGFILRLLIYLAVTGGLLAVLMRVAAAEIGADAFRENATVENTQFAIVLLAGLGFVLAACRWPGWRAVCGFCTGLCLIAGIREMDYTLDHALPFFFGWKGPAAVVLIGTLIWVWSRRRDFWDTFGPFVASPAGMLAWIGLMTVVIFAQIIGEGRAWEMIMGEAYEKDFKRVLEELVELVGYMHLLYAGIEAWCGPPGHLPRGQAPPETSTRDATASDARA